MKSKYKHEKERKLIKYQDKGNQNSQNFLSSEKKNFRLFSY